MGYKIEIDPVDAMPVITKDPEGTTSWRDAKKALRQWYLDRAKALRQVSERDYFPSE